MVLVGNQIAESARLWAARAGGWATSRSAGYGTGALPGPVGSPGADPAVFVSWPDSAMLCYGYLSRLPARRFRT
jgi:hypothetical protein